MTTGTDRLNGIFASLAVKAPCLVATNAAITLSGEQTVNSVAVTEGDRVLVKDQDDATENGIYNVSESAWQRAADFDGNRDVTDGTLIIVTDVGLYEVDCSDDPIVIGTSELTITLKFSTSPPVTSVFGRTGAVTAQQSDYDSFFLTPAEAAALFALISHTHDEDDITDLGSYLENVVEDTTPQLGGNLDANGKHIQMGDEEIERAKMTDYGITHQTLTSTSNATAFDYTAGQSAAMALSENTTLSITNPPASGTYGEIQILITQDSSARTVTWPASFNWPGGTAPDLSTTGSVHVVHAFTVDGGTTWFATHAAAFSVPA